MKNPTIKDAAQRLGLSSTRVFKTLRDHDVIGSMNVPRQPYRHAGFFDVEYRDRRVPGTGIRKQYSITTVTPRGLIFLQDLLDGVATARQLLEREQQQISQRARPAQ